MSCPDCGAAVTPDQKFCFDCGTELSVPCSNCGAALPAGSKFCGECGTPVESHDHAAPPTDEPTPERRLVSVLFADLVGFTATSESRDPEEVRDFLTRYTELASETIRRYGGTVDKFLGDGVMAIWGTPTAFEDDAERAVRAALDLTTDVAALGHEFGVPDLSMRAGIATGEAAVTVESGSHGMVAGDLVNTASRLEGAAAPGTALVNDVAKHATESAIAYEDAGEVSLKGKTEPVSVWRPLSIIAMRGGAGRIEGIEPPFVGRTSDLQLLKDLFKATARDGRAHLVSIQGIPGIGKSRLAWEFEKHLDGLADTFYWHQGRSPAYGEGVTFWSLGEMVRRRAGIAENEDDATTVARLDSTVDEFVPEGDRHWVATSLQTLLGVGDLPGIDRDELFAAWRSFFQHLAVDQPVVMVFEDLQWADHGTIDFIESLLEWSRDYPMFVVTLARPELLDRRKNWGAGQRGFTGLHLEPLSSREIEEMLNGLVPGMPEDLTTQIVERSEGVPLYAVETVRMLMGQGQLVDHGDGFELEGESPELAIPETLHALVAARLDTLDPEDRQLLQKASVLGQTFTVKSVADLASLSPGEVEERLEPMIRREILGIEADPRSPERGQYRFVQSVIKEVAYSGLAKAEKSALHIRVAELLTESGDEELAGVIASHYMDAYQSLNERDRDESLREKALAALTAAAERASGLGSNAQAVAFLEQALEVVTDPARVASLANGAGEAAVLAAMSEKAEGHFETAIATAKNAGDLPLMLRATAGLANVLLMGSRVKEAIELLARTSENDTGDVTEEWVAIHSQAARAHAFYSEGEKAMALIDRALKEAADVGLREVLADALVTKGWALGLVDRILEAAAVTEGALASADRHGFHRVAMRARNNIISYVGSEDPAWALQVAQTGFEEATRLGNLDDRGILGTKVVLTAQTLGKLDLAQEIIDELSESTLPNFALFSLMYARAIQAGYRGDLTKAIAIVEEREDLTRDSSSLQDRWADLDLRTRVLLMGKDVEASLRWAKELVGLPSNIFGPEAVVSALHTATRARDAGFISDLLATAEELGHVSERFQAAVASGRAALSALQNRSDEALSGYLDASEAFRTLGLPLDLALCQLERLMLLGPDHEGADDAADEAREIWEKAGVVPHLELLNEIAPPAQT